MGIQKYRFDVTYTADADGVQEIRTEWAYGPSLAGLRNCPWGAYGRHTVYVQGEPDTFFSQPAAIQVRGKRIKGWIGREDGKWQFHPEKES